MMLKMKFVIGVVLISVILLFGCTGTNPKSDTMVKTDGSIKDDKMTDSGNTMNESKENESMMRDGKMDKNSSMEGWDNDTMHNSMNNSMTNESMSDHDNMMTKTKYVPFEKSAYDKARNEGKVIFLEFYANWCPECKAQAPILDEAFAEIKNPNIIGFRVNYKDSDTDSDEVSLARQFGITYQHTHVILDSTGNVVKKATGGWDKETIESEISHVVG